MPWPEQFLTLIQCHSPLTGHASIVVTCSTTSEQMFDRHTYKQVLGYLPFVTKSGNRVNYCGRNSSELSCMSSTAGNQSIVPGFSESRNYAAKKERDVLLIFISPSERAIASHTVIFELYTSQNDVASASRATFVKDIRTMI